MNKVNNTVRPKEFNQRKYSIAKMVRKNKNPNAIKSKIPFRRI
ncbi:hypothetical protein I600_2275 [Maribacter dokdonensis DSW-8]|nr:hypothetical protein I600_2275 [Maribacter dokdonensis DSW-8]